MRSGLMLQLGLAAALSTTNASAADPPPPAAAPQDQSDDATRMGREAYRRGLEHKKAERWEDALAAFRESEGFRDHPLIQYSIGYCLRALGRYVAARERFAAALAAQQGLTPLEAEEAKAYFDELERLLVRVEVTLEPATAALAVDGRPLRAGKDGERDALLASVEPPGEARSPGKSKFLMVIEPGAHLFVATRPGHQDAVVQKTYRAGDTTSLDLRLDVLPARITLQSIPVRGIVRVDGREVGVAPLEFERPAGKYRVEVLQEQYETYAATLDLYAGERTALTAKLVPQKIPLYKKWWFWVSIGAAAATAIGVTAAATHRPPDYLRGNTNWLAEPAAVRW